MTAPTIRPEIAPFPSCLDALTDGDHFQLDTIGGFVAQAVAQLLGPDAEVRLRAARQDPRATPEQRERAAVLQQVVQCWRDDV